MPACQPLCKPRTENRCRVGIHRHEIRTHDIDQNYARFQILKIELASPHQGGVGNMKIFEIGPVEMPKRVYSG